MLVDEVLVLLGTIADLSENDVERYSALADIVVYPYKSKELSDDERNRLGLYLASKVYYQICLGSKEDDISSFSAGDIKVTAKESRAIERARIMMESALEAANDLVEDKGFSFMEV